jgi:hypothetical protein
MDASYELKMAGSGVLRIEVVGGVLRIGGG